MLCVVKAYLLTKEYDKAIADFAKVGECGYKLFPDYKQLFKVANERCEEIILAVQYIEDPTGYGTGIQKYCAAFTQGAKDSRGCWGDLQVTPALVNLFMKRWMGRQLKNLPGKIICLIGRK